MENLNNSQLVLLAILVSFVTSIATGILTVSLLDEQSPTVVQTINRVVERTVETVVPGDTKTVVKEVPVIVTEEELIVKVVDDQSATVGRLTNSRTNSTTTYGLAFVVEAGKYLVTAGSLLPGENNKRSGPYYLTTEDGTIYESELAKLSADKKIAVLKVTQVTLPETETPSLLSTLLLRSDTKLTTASLSTDNLSVGQTVIALGSINSDASPVTIGIISSLTPGAGTSTIAFKTNAANQDNLGGPLFSIQGEVIGLNLAAGTAVPAALIQSLIDSIE